MTQRKTDRSRRRFWTAQEERLLRELYPDTPTKELAARLGRSLTTTYQHALKLGLRKSAAYLASPAASRFRRGDNVGAAYRFPKGHVPANKGLRRPGWAPGRMRETQFRKGERRGVAVKLWKPIGTERVSKDGYLERKINNNLPLQRRWRAVHLLLWEEAHGPLPAGHAVVFKNGDKADIRLENLEMITRRELMLRNTVHNLPAPLPEIVQLLGALNRKINRRTRRDEEQDRGSQESPVRRPGGAGGPGEADGAGSRSRDRRGGTRHHRLREGGGGVHQGDGHRQPDGLHPIRGRRPDAAAPRRRRAVTITAGARAGGVA